MVAADSRCNPEGTGWYAGRSMTASAALLSPSHPYGGSLVNVSYLLVTTAWLAGAQPGPAALQDAKDKAAPPKVVVHGSSDACCQPSCCDDNWRHRLRDRCRGLFSRRGNDCCDPCPKPQPCCERPRPVCCTPAPVSCCNDSCCERPRLLDRLRGLFRRDRDCCNGCGSDPCCHPTTMPRGEPIPPPKDKKMPKGTTEPKTETQLLNPGVPQIPFNTPALQTPPLAPTNPGNLERRERDF